MQVGPLVQRLLDNGVQLLVLPHLGVDHVKQKALESKAQWFAVDTMRAWLGYTDSPPLVTAVVMPPDPEPGVVADVLAHRDIDVPIIVIHQSDLKDPNSKLLVRELIRSVDLSTAMRML